MFDQKLRQKINQLTMRRWAPPYTTALGQNRNFIYNEHARLYGMRNLYKSYI